MHIATHSYSVGPELLAFSSLRTIMSTAEESLFTTHAEFTSQWIYEEAVAWRETVRGWDNLDAFAIETYQMQV